MMTNVLEYEELVFNLVQEYLDKNRVFKMDKIVPYVQNSLSRNAIRLTVPSIKKIIVSLIEKNKIAEGSMLTKEDVLENPTRVKIYEYIVKNPGVYFNKIVKETEINIPVVAWHINMLIKFDFVKKEKIDNRDIYYKSDLDIETVKKAVILSSEKNQKILFFLKENDSGLSKTQLSDALQMHPNTISKCLEDLENIKVINNLTESNKTLYFLTEKFRNNQ